ncbi:PREDICTED: epithelial chloride channel protein-like [Nanorana parkeri]|uniref:epithelial chloride channel protein-like n=1 Tax=Nanorana parkeri TaxID=125878 RepID=UPI000854DFF9|nr:PREDICTED: epithelial chloride channel protein-like [Nanorana parkeri]
MADWPVLVLLGFYFFSPAICSMVKVTDGGYDDIVIAIHPAVPENETMIEKVKLMIKEATQDLFNATKQRLFIRSIKILIPLTWSQKATYGTRSREKYETAHVIIANTLLNIGDGPYTRQYGGCREQGRFIHLTPNFLMNEDLISVYGPKGKLFVREWARLRWGVFEEYNTDQPFYISPDLQVEATRCSVNISGIYRVPEHVEDSCLTKMCTLDADTGLYDQRCTFFPERNQIATESIMYFPGLNSVSEFCTEDTHSMEAPTMQNRMCDCHSTWDIIRDSSDINLSLPRDDVNLPEPVFSLLRHRERVITLLLDASESMASNNRLWRVHQAADIFLTEAIAPGTYVGLVEFSSYPFTLSELRQINNDADRDKLKTFLPTAASQYGSDFCSAIQMAFKVNKKLYGSVDGTEILFLADGSDIKSKLCFPDIRNSGAIIHVIALSSTAAKDLEEIAHMTGGLKYFSTDNLQLNDLIDAFIGISNENGEFAGRVSQLESNSFIVNPGDCLNGTVLIDSTVGGETFFTVTWQSAAPNINLIDPAGNVYSTDNITIHNSAHLSRLKIPESAMIGVWSYVLCNTITYSQVLGLVVTSKAGNANVPPITVDVYMNKDTNNYPTPMIVYATVSQGLLPVKGARVTAKISSEEGSLTLLELLDNGAGADIAKNDGIYSKYFFTFPVNGRYNVKVRVEGEEGECRLTHPRGRAFYLRGFVENGKVVMKPSDPLGDAVLPAVGSFKRAITGSSFVVSAVADAGKYIYPPSKITDLEAQIKENRVVLSWTATGDDLDWGTAQSYKLGMNKNIKELRDNFKGSTLMDISSVTPSPAGTREEFQLNQMLDTANGTVLYFALIAIDKNLQESATSNIAQAAFLPPITPGSTAQPITKCSTPNPKTCTTVKFIQECDPTIPPKQPPTCPPKPSPKCTTPGQTTD